MSKTQKHTWSTCPDCGGYSSEGHTGTERCRAYKPAQGHTPGQPTPGPWMATKQLVGILYRITTADNSRGVHKPAIAGIPNGDNAEANARLIASAPDLLAACKGFCDLLCINTNPDIARQVTVAHAAIAKAEGRTQ